MFLGAYEHTLDDKGRLAIPARFRAQLSDGLVLTRSLDVCLQLFPLDYWATLTARISALSLMQEDARTLRRLLFAGAAELDLDRQGRILIPQSLRDHAVLQNQAMLVGLDTHVEIWAAERWQAEQARMEQNSTHMATQLSELGI